MTKTPAQLVAAYERGLLTRSEAAARLIGLATDVPSGRVAAGLPDEWLAVLREECERFWPPPSSGGVRVVQSVCGGPGYDADRVSAEAATRWRAGLQAWQAFFGTGGSRVEPTGASG